MARPHAKHDLSPMPVLIDGPRRAFECELMLPKRPRGTVVFAAGQGLEEGFCSAMIDALSSAQVAVLQLPQLAGTWDEMEETPSPAELGACLQAACHWLERESWTSGLAQGFFGVGGMAAPMLLMASDAPPLLQAMVIVEGSADMSEADLEQVQIPSLFIADAQNPLDADLHQEVALMLHCESKVVLLDKLLVPPMLALDWYLDHFEAYYKSPREQSSHLRAQGLFPEAFHGA